MNSVRIKEKLQAGQPVIGTMFCDLHSPAACRIAQQCGFEFVIFDTEHSRGGVETLSWLFRAARDIDYPAIVRAPAFEGQWPTRYLDLGASGNLIPRVETAEEAERIVSWAFRQFAQQDVIGAGETVAMADVWLGAEDSVPLVPATDVSILVPVIASDSISARVEYDGPVAAPIIEGQELGRLVVDVDGLAPFTAPLIAGRAVAQGGFMPRVRTAAMVLGQQLGLAQP